MVTKQHCFDQAKDLFEDLEVQVVLSNRYLGGSIGSEAGTQDYVREKVQLWVEAVEKFAEAAAVYRQAVYCAFTKSLSMEWAFLQRVVGGCDELYSPLREVIQNNLTPALFGGEILEYEHELFALPAKMGGLALYNLVSTAAASFNNSKEATSVLQDAVRTVSLMSHDHLVHCKLTLRKAQIAADKLYEERLSTLLDSMPAAQNRCLLRIIEGESSGWLTVLPLASEGFDLSATQFRDQLAIRYKREPVAMPVVMSVT